MKRFYKNVTIVNDGDNKFNICLDGRAIKTPDKHILNVPNIDLANAIKVEWDAQTDTIKPQLMPMTAWATTIIDRVHPNRAKLERDLLSFIDTDLICYRAPNLGETELMGQAQINNWDPVLNWFKTVHGLKILTTTELAAIRQSNQVHNFFAEKIVALNNAEFAVLLVITQGVGSILLGFAYLNGAFDADYIFDAAFVEEKVKFDMYNEEFYGSAPDQIRRETLVRNDLITAKIFLNICKINK